MTILPSDQNRMKCDAQAMQAQQQLFAPTFQAHLSSRGMVLFKGRLFLVVLVKGQLVTINTKC